MTDPIRCESRIVDVVVYARGAVVTREVELPAGLPSEAATLLVGNITPMAEPGSVRTVADGERRITGVSAPLVYPQTPSAPKPDEEEIRRLEREYRRAAKRHETVFNRIGRLEGMALEARMKPTKRKGELETPGVNQRVASALAVNDLVAELLDRLDVEHRNLQQKMNDIQQKLDELHSARRAQPGSQQGPRREVQVALGAGSDHLRKLQVSYNVKGARWWPAYSARLTDNGRHAEFSVEAFVAQNTGEDWTDTRLGLCTADMVQDITLPELQSLRLGRRQPPRRKGFREPPEGLDAMFSAYDETFGEITLTTRAEPEGAPMPPPAPMPHAVAASAAPVDMEVGAAAPEMDDEDMYGELVMDDIGEFTMDEEELAKEAKGRSRGAPARKKRARDMQLQAPAPSGAGGAMMDMLAEGGEAPEPAAAAGMDERWLDFDALELAPNEDYTRRGRLQVQERSSFPQASSMVSAVESLSEPAGARDPLHVRGMFDHRFDADGVLDIPAGGKPHRVRLLSKEAPSRMVFRCVPLEDERVFREVALTNPLDTPLLPGPVDVFFDGALLITSSVKETEPGGTIRFGLGEEQRISIARNVRAREESKGVFRGGTAMDHEVSIEAASSLSADVELELVDRIPVTHEKGVEVELLSSEPQPEKYDQSDRDHRVKGGLRWKLPLKAGGKAEVNFSYRIGFDKDYELVGGNRRE